MLMFIVLHDCCHTLLLLLYCMQCGDIMRAGGLFVQINVGQDLAFMLHFIYLLGDGGCVTDQMALW